MASEPTNLRGYMDATALAADGLNLDGYGAVVDYLLENEPKLQHPQSVRTFALMRHDPQLSAILQAYGRAIERAQWSLDPTGCRDEVVQAMSDDLGLPIRGYNDDEPQTGARRRGFTWCKHLRVVGLYRAFGHMFFEQAWSDEDGRWRLDVVQERMPHTIQGLDLDTDGTLAAALQGSTNQPIRITAADHRLVYYTRDREGSNYFGTSLMRASYGMWLIKDQMLRVHAESIRRFGMGVPEVQAPAGAVDSQIAQAQRIASGIRAGHHSGVGLPNGFTYNLRGMTGTVPDALAFITYLDRMMTRSTLTSILDMAAAERGNRSLGETVMDLMVLAQQADAEFIADEATAQIVVPLVDANWGENEAAPQLCVGDVGADVQLTAQDLNWLLQWGGLRADQPARGWIRQRWGIPAEDPNDPVNQAPVPDNTEPQGGH